MGHMTRPTVEQETRVRRVLSVIAAMCFALLVARPVPLAAEQRDLKIIVSPKAHPRVLYGVGQLAAAVAREGDRAQIITGEPTAIVQGTIAVGVAADAIDHAHRAWL
jgi:hypothetical protein